MTQVNTTPQFFVDVENEQMVISTLLQNPKAFALFESVSSTEYFLNSFHQNIIKAFVILVKDSKLDYSLDTLTIIGKENNYFSDVEYLYKIIHTFPILSEDNLRKHCAKLRNDFHKHKALTTYIPRMMELSYSPLVQIEDLIAQATYMKRELESGITAQDTSIKTLKEVLAAYDNRDTTFIPTGYSTLDEELVKGYFPGGITIVAGRPGCGKSSFVVNSAVRLMNSKVPVILFSIEMVSDSIIERVISLSTDIPLVKLAKHPELLTTQEKSIITYQRKYLEESKYLFICDDKRINLDRIYREIYKFKQVYEYPYAVVIVDLIDKLQDLKQIQRTGMNLPRVYEIVLDEFQEIGKELNVHIILTAQISRESENTKDKRPKLRHLKHSGGLEQNADLVLLLYREKYYNPLVIEDIMEVEIAKQRFGGMHTKLEFLFITESTKALPIAKHLIDFDPMDT